MKTIFLISILLSVHVFAAPLAAGTYDEDKSVLTDGSRPNLPSGRIIGNAPRNAKDAAKDKTGTSSGDFFESLTLSGHYSRTSFDDSEVNSSGYVDERAFTLSGRLSDSTTISFGYSRIKYRYGWSSPAVRMIAHGYELSLHHDLNENFGVGAYSFVQDIDIERQGKSYTAGGGVLVTSYHDLGIAQLTTASSVSYVDYDFDDDFIFVGLVDLSKDITDWMAVAVNTSWTDSITDNADNADGTYWTVGADVRFSWDSFHLDVGYEKTLELSNYKDNTLNISITENNLDGHFGFGLSLRTEK